MLARLWDGLKRRRALQVAGVYAVAAWGLFSVLKTLIDTFEAPKWTAPGVLVLLVLGLPAALVVAYLIERAAPAEEAPQRGRITMLEVGLLSALAVAIGVGGAFAAGLLGEATVIGRGAPDKSVAVLPFAAYSPEPDADYFADGLTEEVINNLAQVNDLKVAGRTSAFYFKGKNEDLREVGRRLGVANVVEGSVRREGDRLRVTAQLVSVKDGFHLWSKTYDRRMTDALAVQTEIGAAVAEALKSTLTPPAPAKDRSPEAYQLELTARAQLRRAGLQSLQEAVAGYRKLTRMEPDNADAWAGLARATITLAQSHLSTDFGEAQKTSQAAVDRAIRLDPYSSQAWLAKATVARVLSIRIGGAQYEQAFEQAARKAVALDPRNPEAQTLLAVRLADTGRPAEAVEAARKALAVDPLNRSALMSLAAGLMRVGQLGEAEIQYRNVIDLYPDYQDAKYRLGMLLVEKGRLDQAEPWLRAVSAEGDDPFMTFQAAWVYMNLGMPEEAHRVNLAVKGSPGRELALAGDFANRGDFAGMLAFGRQMAAKSDDPFWPIVEFQGQVMLHRYPEALAALKKVRPDLLAPDATVAVTDLNLPLMVAHVLKETGDAAQAERLMAAALAATQTKPGERPPNDWHIVRAKVFAERGQNAEALGELEAAVRAGWRTPFLFDDSVWIQDQVNLQGLKTDPKFKALLEKVRADLATQRQAVLAERAR